MTQQDTTAEAVPDVGAGPARARRHRRVPTRELSVFAALVALVAVTAVVNPRFLDPQGLKDLLLNATIFIVMAVGQALVVITRNVDLSVGSILGMTAFSTGAIFSAFHDAPLVVVFVAGIVLGAVLGAINGLIVTAVKVPALVITLGTLYIYRGVLNAWAGSTQYFIGDAPASFGGLAVRSVLGLPLIALAAIVVAVVVGVALYATRVGRDLYAVGSDPDAARLFGLKVDARVVLAFLVCGGLTGLAGVLYAARFNSVGADTGTGFELQIVAAVVVGGVAIFGGSGSAVGAAIGAVLLTTMTGSLAALDVSKFWQQAIVGVLIIGSILIDRIIALRTAKRLLIEEDRVA
ncbi:MAG: ABC transporter permease [Janthinobacterium lividum]